MAVSLLLGYTSLLWDGMITLTFTIGLFSLLGYILPLVYQWTPAREENFKIKYGCSWAIVVGSIEGINAQVIHKLARQSINVVIVSEADEETSVFHKNIQTDYPNCQFRFIPVNFTSDVMESITSNTADISANVLIFNMSDINIGLFADIPERDHVNTMRINCECVLRVTHWFLNRYLKGKNNVDVDDVPLFSTGAIIYVSSPAGFSASPFALTYGSTKAFLTHFSSSLAAEVRGEHLDVLTVHTSPTRADSSSPETVGMSPIHRVCRFLVYSPEQVASVIFSRVGRFPFIYNQGYWPLLHRMLFKFVDDQAFACIISWLVPYSNEYKRLLAVRMSEQGL
ncbi:short-chain dehydrogenase [Planoprotostelium fungivorum]|uniref:Short-chain dehydrogenase n=1 Tax=Planoprotostelium fungivorum TaxID=1890364 RepID=A0A2P6N9U4_9EUKA|nr:short-chain dehydrogenase [Planoprotostelium fungivorum]